MTTPKTPGASSDSGSTRAVPSHTIFGGVPWVLVGNAVYMLSMAGLTFLLPRFVSPAEFGQWQLYQFYALYLGYVTFGYSDGLLLRLAGRPRTSYSSKELTVGFFALALSELLLFGAVLGVLGLTSDLLADGLLPLAVLGVLFFIPRVLVTFILQAAAEARAVALTTLVERVVLLAGFGVFLLVPGAGLGLLLWADVAGKAVGFAFALWLVRGLVLDVSARPHRTLLARFLEDCRDGAFVALSNLTAIGLNGVTRAIVAAAFGTVAFGQLSLALQVSTVLLVVINSVAAAVFPNVQRAGKERYGQVYRTLTTTLAGPAALSLAAVWPLAWVLRWWIPDYDLAISLMIMLFPVGYFEVKSRGVLAVLMKSLRRERAMFAINLGSAVVGAAGTIVATRAGADIQTVLLPFVLTLALRTLLMEVVVSRALGVGMTGRTLLDLGLVGVHYALVAWGHHPLVAAIGVLAFAAYALRLAVELRTLRGATARPSETA